MHGFHALSGCTSDLSLEFRPGTAQQPKKQSLEASYRGPQIEVQSLLPAYAGHLSFRAEIRTYEICMMTTLWKVVLYNRLKLYTKILTQCLVQTKS